jgi:hypothetical protein
MGMANLESYLPPRSRVRYDWEEFVDECLMEMYVEVRRDTGTEISTDKCRLLRGWWDESGGSLMRQAIWTVLDRRLRR